jgi:iron complex outermembrane recepter protein
MPTLAAAIDSSSDKGSELEEIIVTAEKKVERLLDVPIPVTAISAQTLVDTNQFKMADFYATIPGVVLNTGFLGDSSLTIRGLNSGGGNPTVAVTIDDVPYGAYGSGGGIVPDFDPSDLARVEVLRGPQGTLYGASSIGGLIRYVTIDPSTDAVSGLVQANTSNVYNGAKLGYSFRGAVNVPLSDTIAVRVSGFTRQDPGYVDNVLTGQDDVNKEEVDGGRLAALWRPSQEFSLKLTALVQRDTANGLPYSQLGLGDLQQSAVREAGAYDKNIQAYSAILQAKFDDVALTAVTGYGRTRYVESFDISSALGGPGGLTDQPPFDVQGAVATENFTTNAFTQEVRLTAPIGQTIEWLIGGFFTHESSSVVEPLLAEVPLTGESVGELVRFIEPSTFSEYAAFADLTFHVTEQFDVQVGGRESENRQSFMETVLGPDTAIFTGAAGSPKIYPTVHTEDNSFTYLLTPRFKLSSDLMIYARFASGYRPGGPNNLTAPGLPPHFDPDTTRNYEIGVKGDFLGHTLSIDTSLYYTSWKNLQLGLVDVSNEQTYAGNGGGAKSQGIEFSAESRPLNGLTVALSASLSDAVLTQPLPATSTAFGASGSRLPYSSRFSGALSLQQAFPLTSSVSGFVGGVVSYMGDRLGGFTGFAITPRQNLPAYAKTDLRAGVKYNSWTVNLFANNVADRRGVLDGGADVIPANAFFYIEPRTVGLSIARAF